MDAIKGDAQSAWNGDNVKVVSYTVVEWKIYSWNCYYGKLRMMLFGFSSID